MAKVKKQPGRQAAETPPCSNPPSRSSSLPPGACITPSNVMNSDTISFRIEPFCFPQTCFVSKQDDAIAELSAFCSSQTITPNSARGKHVEGAVLCSTFV